VRVRRPCLHYPTLLRALGASRRRCVSPAWLPDLETGGGGRGEERWEMLFHRYPQSKCTELGRCRWASSNENKCSALSSVGPALCHVTSGGTGSHVQTGYIVLFMSRYIGPYFSTTLTLSDPQAQSIDRDIVPHDARLLKRRTRRSMTSMARN
jgi:hypothetical protein